MITICVLEIIFLLTIVDSGGCSHSDELLKVLDLSHCPFQVEPIGCHKDVFDIKKRTLPDALMNSRDVTSLVYQSPSIQWKNYHHWVANFICECAKKLFEKKSDATSDYIGLQFYGECWGRINKSLTAQFDRYGKSNKCIDTSYKKLTADNPSDLRLYVGEKLSNYVYRISRYYRSCPEMHGPYMSQDGKQLLEININDTLISGKLTTEKTRHIIYGHIYDGCKGEIKMNEKDLRKFEVVYHPKVCKLILKGGLTFTKRICKASIECPRFKSHGCWADPLPRSKPSKRPMNTYAMNERDPYSANWNGNLINWKKWGQGYLANLLCRCAKIAKQTKKKYFSIQFYGECWTSDNKDFMKYGKVIRCMDGKFKTCPEKDNMFRTNPCAGAWEANKVYEITQGIYKCASSPCYNGGECITNGPKEYKCTCRDGFSGIQCEKWPEPIINIEAN